MTKQELTLEIEKYTHHINILEKDIIRLEGVILYLQSKIKDIDAQNKENLTNQNN